MDQIEFSLVVRKPEIGVIYFEDNVGWDGIHIYRGGGKVDWQANERVLFNTGTIVIQNQLMYLPPTT